MKTQREIELREIQFWQNISSQTQLSIDQLRNTATAALSSPLISNSESKNQANSADINGDKGFVSWPSQLDECNSDMDYLINAGKLTPSTDALAEEGIEEIEEGRVSSRRALRRMSLSKPIDEEEEDEEKPLEESEEKEPEIKQTEGFFF